MVNCIEHCPPTGTEESNDWVRPMPQHEECAEKYETIVPS